MFLKHNFLFLLFLLTVNQTLAQSNLNAKLHLDSSSKFRLSFPVIILTNIGLGETRTNTKHIEAHFKYEINSKNIVGIKFATWQLFQPMGIVWWDGLLDKIKTQTEFYPGHLKETGLGITYQRMIWKGLFVTTEILPLSKTYLDLNKAKIDKGFKLYTSLHVGYHIPFFKNRMFVEPQIHSQTWLIDTKAPSNFNELDIKWRKYFLFEPNIYLGVKF